MSKFEDLVNEESDKLDEAQLGHELQRVAPMRGIQQVGMAIGKPPASMWNSSPTPDLIYTLNPTGNATDRIREFEKMLNESVLDRIEFNSFTKQLLEYIGTPPSGVKPAGSPVSSSTPTTNTFSVGGSEWVNGKKNQIITARRQDRSLNMNEMLTGRTETQSEDSAVLAFAQELAQTEIAIPSGTTIESWWDGLNNDLKDKYIVQARNDINNTPDIGETILTSVHNELRANFEKAGLYCVLEADYENWKKGALGNIGDVAKGVGKVVGGMIPQQNNVFQ